MRKDIRSSLIFVAILVPIVTGLLLLYSNFSTVIDGFNPILQFLLYNISIYLFLFVILKSVLTDMKLKDISLGTLGVFFAWLGLDAILPEYHVSTSGLLVQGGILGASSTDYLFGYLGSLLGISGIFLFLWTYVLLTGAVLVASVFMVKNWVKRI